MSAEKFRQPRPLASEPVLQQADSPYRTAQEMAVYIRYRSAGQLYKAIANGLDIPVRYRGRTLLFDIHEVDRWLAGESRVRLLSEARARRASSKAG